MESQPIIQENSRPTALLLVYSWDMLRGIVALFGALAAFGGGVLIRGQVVTVSLPEQIFSALSAASYAAALFIVGTLLTRQVRWIQLAQIVILAASIATAILSLVLQNLIQHTTPDSGSIIGITIFSLIDLLALRLMITDKVFQWFSQLSKIPKYVSGTIGFWLLSSTGLFILHVLQ